MELTYENGKYYMTCEYSQRDAVRKMGFKWCDETKKWFTPSWWVAMQAPCNKPSAIQEKMLRLNRSYSQKSQGIVRNPKLMEFQKAGVEEIMNRQNVLLADEQGLGKTIQVIEYLNIANIAGNRRVLIICPASLKLNWQRELLRFGSKFSFYAKVIRHGKDKIVGRSVITGEKHNVVIVNYDLLKSPIVLDEIIAFNPTDVIGDEAHYLKNAKTSRAKLVAKIIAKAKKVILVTGTPILNRPIEVHNLLKMISPDTMAPYEDYRRFAYRFCEAHEGRWGFDVSGASNVEELGGRLRATCMIRRLKKDVLEQLPEKTLQIIPFEQDKHTKKIIEQKEYRYTFNIEDLKKHPEKGGVGELAEIRHELALAKLPESINYIYDLMESVDKLVIFAHHRDVIDHLHGMLKVYKPVVLTGGMSAEHKQKAVDSFQNDNETRIFIGQIQAAGTGLTLTKASDVVFVETSWVPGEIHQAIDRCHRIGQKSNVTARFLVVEKSLDEHMLKTIFDKEKIISKIANSSIMSNKFFDEKYPASEARYA